MIKFNCFTSRFRRKKKYKGDEETLKNGERKGLQTLQVKIEQPVKSPATEELKLTTFSFAVPLSIHDNSQCSVKIMNQENPVRIETAEIAYEGEDEHEENSPIKRDFSDLDLTAQEDISGDRDLYSRNKNMDFSDAFDTRVEEQFDDKAEKESENGIEMSKSGHVSDPGIGKAEFWTCPKLQRSCSNVESRNVLRKIVDQLPPSKSQSFEELQYLSEKVREKVETGSPRSEMTHFSADRVMLKKHSSSQVLPSRSRRLWWKLFLWSHRNLHNGRTLKSRPPPAAAALHPQGGYSSDTLEPNQAIESIKMASPGSVTGESMNKGHSNNNNDYKSLNTFQYGVSGLWHQNQWVAFSSEPSPFARVDEWVKDLEIQYPLPVNGNCENEEDILFPPSPKTARSPARSTTQLIRGRHEINLSEEILHANSIIQSLNSSSTVAHISGIGLKVIPTISSFSRLRSVNLSNNFIVQITPGSLPKGLHTLNLSRNKISTIEGLRELTRLRVLDLSYNRISRIGHGLSNCTLIKELYLAGNRISDAEGLHRLSKLTVLELSFNKITTTKALGQLVANNDTLQALDLLGNSIQSNISDDQLRKAVCDLLPKLVYLNKQPIKSQRAREVLTDSVAKAALGNSSPSSSRKAGKRVSQGRSLSSIGHKSSANVLQKSRSRSKGQTHQHLSLKIAPSAQVAASH
ncbi:hypothetical protein F2P56_017951 [Juglans regia]|uniref:Uncharacterized protein LOC109007307 n=2 Tax=Juglans regia TaxID=51240 RepID=A0A2I4GF13_JUGRE|nr:uncharacterized protein LOC109007307 [Juglans regia]KAF5461890.1 hypothetical protein F2P56_017951 [Juglans regia]